MKENENSEYIKRKVKEVLQNFNLEPKVMTLVSDSANVMLKAANLLAIRHSPCYCHALNNVIKKAANFDKANDLIKKCKDMIPYFHRSSKGTRMLNQFKCETLEDGEVPPTNLIQMVRYNC